MLSQPLLGHQRRFEVANGLVGFFSLSVERAQQKIDVRQLNLGLAALGGLAQVVEGFLLPTVVKVMDRQNQLFFSLSQRQVAQDAYVEAARCLRLEKTDVGGQADVGGVGSIEQAARPGVGSLVWPSHDLPDLVDPSAHQLAGQTDSAGQSF